MDLTDSMVLSVPEVARILGISRNSAYAAIRRGEIPTIRIGKRKIVPRAALERMLNVELPASEGPKTNDAGGPSAPQIPAAAQPHSITNRAASRSRAIRFSR